MDSVDVKNAGRYYRLFVATQVLMSIAAISLLVWAAARGPSAGLFIANSDIKGGLTIALEMFRTDCGRYPTTMEGLNVLVSSPTGSPLTNYHGPYLDNVPYDPWGRLYVYRFPAIHSTNAYDLYSLGPDGISKSSGNDPDDIGNWEKPWSPGFTGDDFWGIAMLLLTAIPFLFAIRVVAGFFSIHLQLVIEQNRWADRIWCVLAVTVFLVLLLMPKIC